MQCDFVLETGNHSRSGFIGWRGRPPLGDSTVKSMKLGVNSAFAVACSNASGLYLAFGSLWHLYHCDFRHLRRKRSVVAADMRSLATQKGGAAKKCHCRGDAEDAHLDRRACVCQGSPLAGL